LVKVWITGNDCQEPQVVVFNSKVSSKECVEKNTPEFLKTGIDDMKIIFNIGKLMISLLIEIRLKNILSYELGVMSRLFDESRLYLDKGFRQNSASADSTKEPIQKYVRRYREEVLLLIFYYRR
jgi:hypothetical protein